MKNLSEYASVSFWNDEYVSKNFKQLDWYFEIQKLKTTKFDIRSYPKNKEILVVGVGTSSIIDYFWKEHYTKLIFIDFSDKLIKHLEDKYLKEDNETDLNDWDCKYIYYK